MKFNKQKIDQIKERVKNIKERIRSSKKTRVPKKYYALLILMLALGIITLSNNIERYTKSKQEDFREYKLDEVNSDDIEISNYQVAISSISTTESNIEEVVETISSNEQTRYIMPVDGEIIKGYATEKLVYSETLGMWKTHPGIDIKAKLGDKVKSASDGVVQVVENDDFYGNTIKISTNEGYTFVYSNLDDTITLKQGDIVKQGEKIGIIGVSATGELADSTHLHFEVIKDQLQVNPQDLIN